ncbi:repeat protein 1 [Halocaridina rubra]|uniref:Repeat protein 1 n=1 Tax=Halocaridina rubra TaxID=373956 RepID=A0AAN8X376_HALRR
MRINCEVQVSNRLLPSHNMSSAKRSSRSSLGLGRPPGSKADITCLFVHLCTVQNKQGTKYKVHGNIEGIFTKFLSEGKFTIRFKDPAHDLCIKADPVLAKSFLQTLKLALQNKNIDKLHLSNLAPAKQCQIEKPKTKLVIENRQNYPITTSFPYSLESLTVNSVALNRVENRIIKLKKLQILNLSYNLIHELPTSMKQMNNLTELHLASNKLRHINHAVFSDTLAKTLKQLDISYNEIEYLPHSLVQLVNLVTLNISGNKLCKLPVSIGRLHKLKFLAASNNKLVELPYSLKNLKLETLNIDSNLFSSPCALIKDTITEKVPCLRELSACVCIKSGFRPTASDIPLTLLNYVSSWLRCTCQRICYESHILACVHMNVGLISHSVTMSSSLEIPALATFCSKKCYERCPSR